MTTEKQSLYKRDARTRRRHAAELRFRLYGRSAIVIGLLVLATLLVTIVSRGAGAFQQSYIQLEVYLDPGQLDKNDTGNIKTIRKISTFGYAPLLQRSMSAALARAGIQSDLSAREQSRILSRSAAAKVRTYVLADISRIGSRAKFDFLLNGRVDGYLKGRVTHASATRDRGISVAQIDLVDQLVDAGLVRTRFNPDFIFGADASDQRPEAAGIGAAAIGSFFMILVVLGLSLPVGVAGSIYLEEFAPRNRFTDIIEVSINNLATVPSIVFGILGLAVFINYMHLPQSAPLVGGLVLTLMTLPTIIISTRASLKSVPPSIRNAALGLGASRMQSVFHHVLPLAAPGILTGSIIGLAQALGETAPLLIIGMVGFIASSAPAGISEGFLAPNSALPAQIYEWSKRADPAFYERAWGGIIILLLFLMIMNLLAIFLRNHFQHRW